MTFFSTKTKFRHCVCPPSGFSFLQGEVLESKTSTKSALFNSGEELKAIVLASFSFSTRFQKGYSKIKRVVGIKHGIFLK